MKQKVISLHRASMRSPLLPNRFLGRLTLREWAVLLLVSEQKSVYEIADELCMEPKSVHNNKNRISRKLGLQGLGKLNLFACQHREVLLYWYGILMPGKRLDSEGAEEDTSMKSTLPDDRRTMSR